MGRLLTLKRITIVVAAAAAIAFVLFSMRGSDAEPAAFAGSDAQIVALGFSPSHDCTKVETKLIAGAKKELLVQAYGFTSQPIYSALDSAKARGVDVRVILDRSNDSAKRSGRLDIEHHHIPTWIDAKHPIAHNKVTIVDGKLVETGSFNYTTQGEKNAENCIVIEDAQLAAAYKANWLNHQAHSTRQK